MKRLVATACLSLLLATANAQDDATFTADVHLVIIDIGVKDKSGKVIPDLKKSDFTVMEDGKPQQVAVFEFQKLDSDEPLPVIPADKAVKVAAAVTPAAPGPLAPKAKPAVATSTSSLNPTPKPVIRYQDRRLVAMLFDFSTMATAKQARAQKSALDFLEHQLKPADVVEIIQRAFQHRVDVLVRVALRQQPRQRGQMGHAIGRV